jgi:hypothetical protein
MVDRRGTRAKKNVEKSYRTPILFFLGVAITASFSAFVFVITRSDRIGAFVASVSITKYREGLPDIQKEWNSSSITPEEELANFKQSQLVPLPTKGDRTLQNKEDVSSLLSDIKSQTQEADLPFVVLLRCHARATESQQHYVCSLLIQEDDSQYLLEDFLKELVEIPSRNVIVLADICDLSFLPSEGIVVNPIATSIRDTCESLNETIGDAMRKSGRNIWIMCSSADGQISHRDRDGTTLFQAACRAAFDSADDVVTLDAFYQYVLSHVHEWSRGTQTPLLFSVLQSDQNVKPNDEFAQNVRLSRFEGTIPKEEISPEKESNGKKNDETAASSPRKENGGSLSRNMIRFVRMINLQDESGKPNSENNAPPSNQSVTKTPTTFREYHEWWKNRKSGEPWVWNGAQFDALNYRLSLQNSIDPKESNESLKVWLAIDSPVKVREAFKGSIISERIVQFWESPDKLPSKYKNTWSRTRDKYVEYAAGVSEYLFWRNLIVSLKEVTYQSNDHSYEENIDTLVKQFVSLSVSLERFRTAIPADDDSGAIVAMESKRESIDRPVDTASLHRSLESLLDELKMKAENQPTKGKKNQSRTAKWTSVDESLLLTLIASPLPGAEPRKQLAKVSTDTSELKNWHPAIDSLLSTEKLNQILTQASPDPDQSSTQYWKNELTLNSLMVIEKLCGFDNHLDKQNNSGSLLDYSDEQSHLLKRFKEQSTPFNAAVNRWHFYHLGEMSMSLREAAEGDRHGGAGIIVSPAPLKATTLFLANTLNNEQYIELKQNNELQQSTERSATFALNVEFLGASKKPESCRLKWDSNIKDADGKTLLKLFTQTNNIQPWKPGEPTDLRVTSGEIKFEIRLASKETLPLNSYLEITKEDNEQLRIPIFTDANRIEMVFINEASDPSRNLFAVNNVLELNGPCFKETTAGYSCFLYNRLPRERTATIKFYKDKQMKQELFSSGPEPVKLSAVDLQKSAEPTRKKIQLTPLKQEESTSSVPKTLFAYIEEAIVPNVRPAPGKVEPIEIRFKPILPVDQTIWEVTTAPDKLGSVPEVEVSIHDSPLCPQKTIVGLLNVKEPGYDLYPGAFSPVEVSKNKPNTLKFPPITSDERYLFAAQIGDYPRAKFYMQDMKETKNFAEVTRPGRLRVKSLEGILPPESGIPIVFPGFQNGPDGRRSLSETYSSLNLEIEADAPNRKIYGSIRNEGLDDEDTGTKRFNWDDRTFLPVIDTEGGNLSVRFDVSDLNEEIQLESLMPGEDETRRLVLRLKAGSVTWERVLILDRKPPDANAKVRKSSSRSIPIQEMQLRDGESFKFFIETKDEDGNRGSGLSDAYYMFGKSTEDRKSAVRVPETFCEAKPTKDGFDVSISVDMMDSFWQNHKKDDLAYLVTIDKAGNEQSSHIPLAIRWLEPKDAPVAKP